MTLDATGRATASKLIGKYGATVTLKHVTTGAYDPSTGTVGTTTTSETVKSAPPKSPFSARTGKGGFMIANGLAQVGDKVFMLAAADLASPPKLEDLITFGGYDWTIVSLNPIYSGELVCVYECLGRID